MTRLTDPLKLDTSSGFPTYLRDGSNALLAEIGSHELARRIHAALIHCRGISTDDLKESAGDKRSRHEIIADLVAMTRQRDDLLAALKTSTNGLRVISRWSITEETAAAITTQILANETAIANAEAAK